MEDTEIIEEGIPTGIAGLITALVRLTLGMGKTIFAITRIIIGVGLIAGILAGIGAALFGVGA